MPDSQIRHFTASDGYRLAYRHWKPAGEPRGYVVALHGIQSHSGWYEYSSNRLCEAGFDVRFLDRRGSGLNERSRGHTPHYRRLINDVVQFLGEVRHQRDCESPETAGAPRKRVILSAVSWGGKPAVAVCAARGELVDALALLYPGICAKVRPNWHQKFRLRLARRLGIHEKMIPLPLDDVKLFTGQPEWQQFIRDDSLALHHASVGLLNASLDLDRLTAETPQNIDCPVLLMSAGKDRIIDNRATRNYCERFSNSKCKQIEYADAEHTLEFEPNREHIFTDLINWLDSIVAEGGNLNRSSGGNR